MKTKKYNHMYDIAFAVDTEVEDPTEVPEKELLLALLRRLANVVEEGRVHNAQHLGFDIGGNIGYCDSHEVDNDSVAKLLEKGHYSPKEED